MLKTTLIEGPQGFDLFNMAALHKNFLSLLVICTISIILSSTFLVGVCNNFKMTKSFSYFLFAVYSIFMAISVVYAAISALHHF